MSLLSLFMGYISPASNNVHASSSTDGGDINYNNNMHQPPTEDATTPPITLVNQIMLAVWVIHHTRII